VTWLGLLHYLYCTGAVGSFWQVRTYELWTTILANPLGFRARRHSSLLFPPSMVPFPPPACPTMYVTYTFCIVVSCCPGTWRIYATAWILVLPASSHCAPASPSSHRLPEALPAFWFGLYYTTLLGPALHFTLLALSHHMPHCPLCLPTFLPTTPLPTTTALRAAAEAPRTYTRRTARCGTTRAVAAAYATHCTTHRTRVHYRAATLRTRGQAGMVRTRT